MHYLSNHVQKALPPLDVTSADQSETDSGVQVTTRDVGEGINCIKSMHPLAGFAALHAWRNGRLLTYSLRATRAKPLAAGAVVSLAGAEPPNIWKSIVPKNSANRHLSVSLRIWPVALM